MCFETNYTQGAGLGREYVRSTIIFITAINIIFFFLEKRYTLTHSGLRNGSLKQSKKIVCAVPNQPKSHRYTQIHTHTHTLTHTRIAKRKGGGFEADLQAKNSNLDRLMCNTPLVKDTPPSFIRDFVNDDIVRDGTCVFGMEFKTNGKKKGRTNNNNKKSKQNNKIKFEMFSHQRHRDRGRLVYTSGWIYNLPWGYTVTRKCIIRCCCLGTWRQYFSIHFSRLFPDSSRQLCVCVCVWGGGVGVWSGQLTYLLLFPEILIFGW